MAGDEPTNGTKVSARELTTLREDHGLRIGKLETRVSDHEAFIQQRGGAKTLLAAIFGARLPTLAVAIVALIR